MFHPPPCQRLHGETAHNSSGHHELRHSSHEAKRIYERRTKPITSAKGHGWNGHRFLCVPHRSWGFGVVGMKWASDWKEEVAKAEAAEQAATEEKAAAAMKKEWFLPSKEVVLELSLCGDVSVRTEKLRKWSSFSHRFGHRSELPFIFEFLRCAHVLHDIFYFWHTASGCSWRLDFMPILTCWMNVFKFKIRQTCISKVIVFCVTPIVPESFMIISSINVLV